MSSPKERIAEIDNLILSLIAERNQLISLVSDTSKQSKQYIFIANFYEIQNTYHKYFDQYKHDTWKELNYLYGGATLYGNQYKWLDDEPPYLLHQNISLDNQPNKRYAALDLKIGLNSSKYSRSNILKKDQTFSYSLRLNKPNLGSVNYTDTTNSKKYTIYGYASISLGFYPMMKIDEK